MNEFFKLSEKLRLALLKLIKLCFNRLQDFLHEQAPYNKSNTDIQNLMGEQKIIEIVLLLILSLFSSLDELYAYKQMKSDLVISKIQENQKKQQKKQESTMKNVDGIIDPQNQQYQELLFKKAEILILCYKFLEAAVLGDLELQLILKPFVPMMQMHCYFEPKIIPRLQKLISKNEEWILTIRKQRPHKKLSSKVLNQPVWLKNNDTDSSKSYSNLSNLEDISNQQSLIFFEKEQLDSGFNIFFFFLFYFKNTYDIEVQSQILELLTSLCNFNNQGINPNQEEMFLQITKHFRSTLYQEFFDLSVSQINVNSTHHEFIIRSKMMKNNDLSLKVFLEKSDSSKNTIIHKK